MKHLKNSYAASVALLLCGCASVSSSNIGAGDYMQISKSGGPILWETNFKGSNLKNCHSEALALMKHVNGMSVKCADSPTNQSLLFSLTVKQTKNVATKTLESNPYAMRVSTSERCKILANTMKQTPNHVVLEEKCN